MKFSEKRMVFTRNLGEFLLWCFQNGYHVVLNECVRGPDQIAADVKKGLGIGKTLHASGLAADVFLYIDGDYQEDSAPYEILGNKWKSMDPLNRWGGDFKDKAGKPKPDGDHFSMEDGGVQ